MKATRQRIWWLAGVLAVVLAAGTATGQVNAPAAEGGQDVPVIEAAQAAPLARVAEAGYVAAVTGERVNIRSGPAEVYYDVARLEPGQQVIVREEQHGWARIAPTKQCFSYIAKEYVRLTGLADGAQGAQMMAQAELAGLVGQRVLQGEVTGNRVRVRAGSVKVPPANANQVQVLMNEGARVEIIGVRDEYYKIKSPREADFYVYAEYLEPTEEVTAQERETLAAQASEQVVETATAGQAVGAFEKEREAFRALTGELEAQKARPLGQQDYTGVREKLAALKGEAQSPSVQAACEALERQVERAETAVAIWEESKEQDEQLESTLAKIRGEMAMLSAVYEVMPGTQQLVVEGEIAESAVFTTGPNRRYLVVDPLGRITHYAIAARPGVDLGHCVGEIVRLKGEVRQDSFSDTKIIYVDNVVMGEPMPAPVPLEAMEMESSEATESLEEPE